VPGPPQPGIPPATFGRGINPYLEASEMNEAEQRETRWTPEKLTLAIDEGPWWSGPLAKALVAVFFALLLLLGSPISGWAQEADATIAGRVINAQTGAFLEGADVRLVEVNRQTIANREGSFTFPRVAPGRYTLRVAYLGIDTRELMVEVAAGQRRFVEVELRSATFRLDEMVITGRIEGQAQALNLQRSSDNLRTVISQDALGQVQEGNIGDALNRLPGITVETRAGVQRTATIRGLAPQYNSVTVDGFTMTNVDGNRDIALDSYPMNTLERVEVVRAVTPDMPGDAIGGTVNLVTRTAFDRSGRTFFGNVGSTNNAKRGTFNRQAEITVGDTFGPEGRLGGLFTASYFEDVRGYDVSNISYQVSSDDVFTLSNNLVYDRDERKRKFGLGANLDYRLSDEARLFVKGMYNYDYRWLHRRGTNWLPLANRVDAITFYREPKNVFQMYIAGANGTLAGWELDARTAYSRADKSYPETFQVTTGFNGVELAVDRADAGFPRFTVTNGFDLDSPAGIGLRNMQITQAPRGEDEVAAEMNARREFRVADLPASFKTGVRASFKDASQAQPDYARYTASGLDVAGLSEPYANTRFFRESNGRARLLPFFPGKDLWLDAFRTQPSAFTSVEPFSTQGRANTDWSISEDILSTYAMGTVDVGGLRILGGVRVERTSNASRANEVIIERVEGADRVTAINPRTSSSSYTNVLPGLHLRWNAGDNLVMRASANRTMSRPAPGDLIPSLQVNAQLTQPAVIIGNPDLNPATSTNLDLSAEYYLDGLGFVSAGVFHKSIDDFVFSERTRLDSGPFAGFDEVRRVNGEGGSVTGLEMAWSRQFSSLPGALSGLGLDSNLTLLSSEGTYPGREGESLPLTRSPDWLTNVILSWTGGALQTRASFMARSDRLTGVGGRAALDRYNKADRTLDFSVEYAVPRWGGRAFFHTRNLLNVPTIEYQGSTATPVSTSYYGRQFNFGLTYDLR